MKVTYLPINQAWAVTLGEQIITLYDSVGPIGTLFDSLDSLDYALSLCGLERQHGDVTVNFPALVEAIS